jgi:hypothetical protein
MRRIFLASMLLLISGTAHAASSAITVLNPDPPAALSAPADGLSAEEHESLLTRKRELEKGGAGPATPQPTARNAAVGAAEPSSAYAGPTATGEAAQATRIETDQKTGTVRFIVDGREVARFERDGLHVRQDVNYGGLLTDTGQAGYAKIHDDKPEPTH